jgi:hypothetical protein
VDLKVRINGGRILDDKKGSVINITGLEPFIAYTLELDDKDFENLAWRIREKIYKVVVDPNQFKTIYVPVLPVGEANGYVNLEAENQSDGIGRILIDFYNTSGEKIAESMSESDGYFDYLGLEPGDYIARIDSVQSDRLDYLTTPSEVPFSINATEDGDIVTGINFVLNQKPLRENTDSIG